MDNFLTRTFNQNVSGSSYYDALYATVQGYLVDFEKAGKSSFSTTLTIVLHNDEPFHSIVDDITQQIGGFYNYHTATAAFIRRVDNEVLIAVHSANDDNEFDYFDYSDSDYNASTLGGQTSNEINVHFYGNKDLIERVAVYLREKYCQNISARIKWSFIVGHQTMSLNTYLTSANPIYDEYYPYIENGVENFINDYISSKQSILILLGPPGTGKTSFIRYMLFKNKMKALAFYDKNMTRTDATLASFITRRENDILILEDADLLLYSREDGNDTMNQLLNTSDGLVNVMNKKIIITANITDRKDIDSALLRPGRCFDIINFRPLTKDEARDAATRGGIDMKFNKKEYTLAELFNNREQEQIVKKQKIGFV